MNEHDISETIGTLYEMMYPYGEYNYDPSYSCIAINRELKTLCRENMRHVLLIVGRYLRLKFTNGTPTPEICGAIQNKIFNICLSHNYELLDDDRARFIIGMKTGVVDIKSEDKNNCDYFRSMANNVSILEDLDLVFGFDNISEFRNLSMYKTYLDSRDIPGGYDLEVIEFNIKPDILNLLKQEKYSEVFKMGADKLPKDNIDEFYNELTETQLIKTQSQLDFFNKMIDMMSDGRLSPYATWDDLCRLFR